MSPADCFGLALVSCLALVEEGGAATRDRAICHSKHDPRIIGGAQAGFTTHRGSRTDIKPNWANSCAIGLKWVIKHEITLKRKNAICRIQPFFKLKVLVEH
jgi:hypothetical protein